MIVNSYSNSLTLNPKCILWYCLKRASQPFWLHFNWCSHCGSPCLCPAVGGTYLGLETELSVGWVQTVGCKGITGLYLVVAKLLNFLFLWKKKESILLLKAYTTHHLSTITSVSLVTKMLCLYIGSDAIPILKLWNNVCGINNVECYVRNM